MGSIKPDLLLGLDAGTTSIKAALFQPDGTCLGLGIQEYSLISNSAEEAELEPGVYWESACAAIRSVLSQARVDPSRVVSLAVSSQGETIIPLDASGNPLYNAIVWLDNRAVKQADALKTILGDEVYAHTGIPEVIPTWSACKILWLKENEPDVFLKTAKFLLVQDYLIFRLTGNFVTDGSVSCTSLLYDISSHQWWKKVLELIGVSEQQLATVLQPGSTAGYLRPEAANDLGLTSQTRVVCGGMDQSVGAIGAGNIGSGVISETTGAALTVQATIFGQTFNPNGITPVYEHSIPGKYLFVPVSPTGGMTYKWFKDQFGEKEVEESTRTGADAYELLNQLAAEVPAGCDGLVLLPHLMGSYSPEINPPARGAFCGFTLHHRRGHFARAILEGVAFLLRKNLEFIESNGVEIHEIRSTGGGSRSSLWNQIKANICQKPVLLLKNEDTALVGDAILAGVACRIFNNVQEGVNSMVEVREVISPNSETELYEEAYHRYCDLDETLSSYFKRAYGTASVQEGKK